MHLLIRVACVGALHCAALPIGVADCKMRAETTACLVKRCQALWVTKSRRSILLLTFMSPRSIVFSVLGSSWLESRAWFCQPNENELTMKLANEQLAEEALGCCSQLVAGGFLCLCHASA